MKPSLRERSRLSILGTSQVSPIHRNRSRTRRYSEPSIFSKKKFEYKKLWNILYHKIEQDKNLDLILEQLGNRIIIIDNLNQLRLIALVLKEFKDRIAIYINRSDEYIFSSSLHSIGCHREKCIGQLGIDKIRLSDPLEYHSVKLPKENKNDFFILLALQAPNIGFIKVTRRFLKGERLYNIISLHAPNIIEIETNQAIHKEIDDMICVALFLKILNLRKKAYIQSCDKYRWISKIPIREEIQTNIVENMIIPYFLSKEIMDIPSIILMGYECAYDCTKYQENPSYDEECQLTLTKETPIII